MEWIFVLAPPCLTLLAPREMLVNFLTVSLRGCTQQPTHASNSLQHSDSCAGPPVAPLATLDSE